MLVRNLTPLHALAAKRVADRLAANRSRALPAPHSLGNTFIPIVCRVDNADLAVFVGLRHSVDHPLIQTGEEITVTRRMSHGSGFIYFFTTQNGLQGFIRSDAVSEVRNG